jgi:uncharacterized protein GlcG (DUF336 family)
MRFQPIVLTGCLTGVLLAVSFDVAVAADCPVDQAKLTQALRANVKPSGGPPNGGFENHEWASIVARDGTVCAIVFSGGSATDQWPGSRVIAMQKASTANSFSLKSMAMATANLFALAQPGQSLYGIIAANPPSPEASAGDATTFGSPSDPMTGKRIGGVIVFGGGLPLYDGNDVVGGLGVSGDSACADHNVAWRVRAALGLDKVPAGVNPERKDAIIYDMNAAGQSASGFGHPKCAGREADVADQLKAGVGGAQLQ